MRQNDAIRALAISPDIKVLQGLEQAAGGVRGLSLVRKQARYPDNESLRKTLQMMAPAVVFLDVESPQQSERIATVVQQVCYGTQIVALGRECDGDTLLRSIRAGMREFLLIPVAVNELERALQRLRHLLVVMPPAAASTHHVNGFISAKSGAGATTAALHLSLEMARHSGKTLLLDFDYRSSLLHFLLKTPCQFGLRDALQHAPELDDCVWHQLRTKVGNIDLVGMGHTNGGPMLSVDALEHFLNYARAHYDTVCVDLPSGFDERSHAVLEQCTTIFLVCTPELPSLYMARRRLELLRDLDLAERTRVVVNRLQPRAGINPHLPKMVGTEIYGQLPNSYAPLQRAIEEGRPVDKRSALAKSFAELAARHMGVTLPVVKQSKGLGAVLRSLLPHKAAAAVAGAEPAFGLLPAATPPADEGVLIVRR